MLIFGGSQGAKAINDSVTNLINENKMKDYQIMWAPGPMQFDIVKRNIKNLSKLKGLKIVPYIYNMEEVVNTADLVIARSGAMTITEVAITGKPAIFIPLPYVSNDHQVYNAKVLADIGAAEIILNKDLNSETLANMINGIIQNPEKIKKMGEQAKTIAKDNVEEKIYKEIEKLVK